MTKEIMLYHGYEGAVACYYDGEDWQHKEVSRRIVEKYGSHVFRAQMTHVPVEINPFLGGPVGYSTFWENDEDARTAWSLLNETESEVFGGLGASEAPKICELT